MLRMYNAGIYASHGTLYAASIMSITAFTYKGCLYENLGDTKVMVL